MSTVLRQRIETDLRIILCFTNSMLLAAIGCTVSVSGDHDINDPDIVWFDSVLTAQNRNQMLNALRQDMPNGTPITVAQRTMDQLGFNCTFVTNGAFSEDPGLIGDEQHYRTVQDASYLLCRKTPSAGMLVCHDWSIAFVYGDANQVTDILVLHQMERP
ncbi:MAG: hypothetical protein AAGG48_32010 [Planctomycetota bacterium]